MVDRPSMIEERESPRKSEETSGSSVKPRMPFIAPASACLKASFTASLLAGGRNVATKSTTGTGMVGTRSEKPPERPLSSGGTASVARAARGDGRMLLAGGGQGGLLLGEDLDSLAVDDDIVLGDFDGAVETAVGRVVAEQVGVGLGVGDVVDGDYLDIAKVPLQRRLEGLASDAPEAVDADACSHRVATSCKQLLGKPVPR